MLNLKYLKFANIGRFVKEQSIDFSAMDRLIEVGAYNKNTGGSSGAGKSTAFHALDYLLGINDIPATALQSRLTKDGLYSEGGFDIDGTSLIVRRSKKEGLYIKFGDEEVSGNVKLAEERLDQIIGIPRKLFKKMVHKKQKEGGFFLNMTAKESYEFLMNALGLSEISNKTVKIDEDMKGYIARMGQLGHAITAFEDSIEEFDEILGLSKEPSCDLKQEDVDALLVSLNDSKKTYSDMLAAKKNELDSKIKPVKKILSIEANPEIAIKQKEIETLTAEKQEKIMKYTIDNKEASDAYQALSKKIGELPFHKSQMNNLIEDMKAQMSQKVHIQENKCPTCTQTWVGDSAEAKIEAINTNIAGLKEEILAKKALVDEEAELTEKLSRVKEIQVRIETEHNLDSVNEKLDTVKHELINLQVKDKSKESELDNEYLTELNQYNAAVTDIRDNYEANLKEAHDKVSFFDKEYSTKKSMLESHSRELSEYNTKKTKIEATLKEKRSNLKEAKKEKEAKKYELSVAEEAKRAVKTYTLQIFQDTLDYIGGYASDILAEIPNMTNATIYFEGCKENSNGSIKDEVNAIINMDGYNNINIKTLSGGERTAIDLAVDLAVIDMIESKAGKGADFFILDEPFEGLEEINISQCLEVLRQVDTNKKIIIVDHNPIAKEMISDKIMIERDGEESVVL